MPCEFGDRMSIAETLKAWLLVGLLRSRALRMKAVTLEQVKILTERKLITAILLSTTQFA